jgi:hypothetical protein
VASMNFVGKLLVLFVFVLSICFMAFAGAVYSAHMNWRTEAEKQKKVAADRATELNDKSAEWERKLAEMTKQVKDATDKAGELLESNKTLSSQVEELKKEKNDLSLARESSSKQSEIAAEEASQRNAESINLRQINRDLVAKRDEDYRIRTSLEDEVRSLKLDIELGKTKNRELLNQVALLQQTLEAAGISANIRELAARDAPPPAVDGKVLDILPPKRRGSTELIEVSLGSDDGLQKGHEMTIYRSGGGKGKYLARIIIVSVTPDRAVGSVVEESRNGVIQKGDNVSTKL